MNFRILSPHAMVSVSQLWLNQQRELFQSISKIAPYLEDVEAAHNDAVALDQATGATDAIAKLTEELARVDYRHDDVIRCIDETFHSGIHHCLIQVPPRQEEAVRLQELLDRLLPRGLTHVKLSYRDEAGVAEAMIANLDEATRARLRAIPVMEGNLLEVVLLWGELGRAIGELDSQRTILVVNAPIVASERQIKSAWIQVVKQVLNGLDLVKGRDEAVTMIREPLLKVVADAEAREARREASAKPAATAGESSGSGSGTGSEAAASGS